MSMTLGRLKGELTFTVAGHVISLGHAEVPVAGHLDGNIVRLSAETAQVWDAVQELFRQQKEQDA